MPEEGITSYSFPSPYALDVVRRKSAIFDIRTTADEPLRPRSFDYASFRIDFVVKYTVCAASIFECTQQIGT
jgi:hypothetical protein